MGVLHMHISNDINKGISAYFQQIPINRRISQNIEDKTNMEKSLPLLLCLKVAMVVALLITFPFVQLWIISMREA